MKKNILTFSFCLMTLSPAAAAQDLPPVEAYTQHPQYENPSLSPDGTRLALSQGQDGGDQLTLLPIAGQDEQPRSDNFDRGSIFGIKWVGDEAVIVQLYGRYSTYPTALSRAYVAYAVEDNRPEFIEYQPLIDSPEAFKPVVANLSDIVDIVSGDGSYALMSAEVYRLPGGSQMWRAGGNAFWARDIVRINVANGTARPHTYGIDRTAGWYTDGNGNVVARVDILDSGVQVILVPDGDDYREIARLDDSAGNGGDVVGLSLDGSAMIVRARRPIQLGLYPVDLTTGAWGDAIFVSPDFDVGEILFHERNGRVEGIGFMEGVLARRHYFDPVTQQTQELLENTFPGHAVQIASVSNDGNKVLFDIRSPARPPALGLFDRQQMGVETISESMPDLVGGPLGEVSAHEYIGGTGVTTSGLLTLPPGREPRNLPTVVLEHAALAPTFDNMAHFLAGRGYAVFRPRKRDLRGLPEVSGMNELGEWIETIQEDISAGVNDLVAKGIADPQRICIVGHGYEAYTALITAVYTPNLFSCVISVDGLTDLRRLVTSAKSWNQIEVNSLNSALVRNYELYSEDELVRFSPVTRTQDISAAVLLVSYRDDDHTASMNAALGRAGKSVEFVELRDNLEDPANYRAENRTIEFGAIERFLAERLRP